jgi:di/tricarboxylate transporter
MTPDALLVFVILTAMVLLFASDRLRLDLVAVMGLLALAFTGVLTADEAVAGFSDPIVVIIAGLFIVSGGLFQTGVADRLGALLSKAAGSDETRHILVIMSATALLSGFMSSTGTVAVMLPVVVSLGWRSGISPSRLLIPLSFASLLGGMLTLIGTPPNIVVSNQLRAQGLAPFNFFDFTPPGIVILIVGLAFMTTVGRRLLPTRAAATRRDSRETQALSLQELAQAHNLQGFLFQLRVLESSPLVGRSLVESAIRRRYRVNILGILSAGLENRQTLHSRSLEPGAQVQAGDTLLVHGDPADVERLTRKEGLGQISLDPERRVFLPVNLGLVEVLLPPRSRLLGQTLRSLRFRDRYRATVVSIYRPPAMLITDIADVALRFGDTLLVKGPWKHIELLRQESRDFVVIAEQEATAAQQRLQPQAFVALGVMLVMLVLMTLELLPTVTSVLLAAVLMVLSGSLKMEDAYRSINWQSVVLIAAVLPMATALEKTGGMQLVVDGLLGLLGGSGPTALMAGLFVLTSVLSQVISNTATSVLLAPVAFQSALLLGVSPHPFLMTVAIAASTAFATPIASPVNTLVLGPGAYRFTDFSKIGIALQVLVLFVTLLVVPVFFPL